MRIEVLRDADIVARQASTFIAAAARAAVAERGQFIVAVSGGPPLGSGQVFLTVEGSDCHKRCQAKHPQHGGGHIYDNRSGRI